MKKLVFSLLFVGALIAPIAALGVASDNYLVVAGNGTVYLVKDGQRRGFPSAAVFQSHGYNFSQIFQASSADLALPEGATMSYADGVLAADSTGTVYLISDGKKRGFTSREAFLGLGYSFGNVISDKGNLNSLPAAETITSVASAHSAGTLINDQGAVYLVTRTGRKGVPTVEIFNSYGWSFALVAPANAADLSLPVDGMVELRGFTVQPLPPDIHSPAKPVISGERTVGINTRQQYAINVSDPDRDSMLILVDWGDGSVTRVASRVSSGGAHTEEHIWSRAGTYAITVTASDDYRHSATNSLTITVVEGIAQAGINFESGSLLSAQVQTSSDNQALGVFGVRVTGEPVAVTRLVLNLLPESKAANLSDVVIRDSAGKIVAGPLAFVNGSATTTSAIVFPVGLNYGN